LDADRPTRGQEGQLLQGPCIALREGNVQARCLIGRRKLWYGAIQKDGKDPILVSQSRGGEHNECDKKRGAFHWLNVRSAGRPDLKSVIPAHSGFPATGLDHNA
jgi:hypothetical protein